MKLRQKRADQNSVVQSLWLHQPQNFEQNTPQPLTKLLVAALWVEGMTFTNNCVWFCYSTFLRFFCISFFTSFISFFQISSWMFSTRFQFRSVNKYGKERYQPIIWISTFSPVSSYLISGHLENSIIGSFKNVHCQTGGALCNCASF